MTVYLEESIMQEGQAATAGSKLLEGFVAPFSATVAERLLESGHKIGGRFGFGEFGLPDLLGFDVGANCVRPQESDMRSQESDDKPRANTVRPYENPPTPLLCNDIFGLYRRYAAENNLCYIRPAYGTVSRYGLIPTAASMDQIGILCANPEEGFAILADIAGHDPRDGAMFPAGSSAYNFPEPDFNKVEKISRPTTNLPHFDLYSHVLCILACGEISHNLNRYDGVKFGQRPAEFSGLDDLYTKTRAAFGANTKLTAIMGALVLSENYYEKYYDKALRLRRVIKEALQNRAETVLPGTLGGDAYAELALAAPAVLAGLPSVTFGGVQVLAQIV